jgi:hypothetical protein
MKQSESIPPWHARPAMMDETRPDDCPFCATGISHVGHVPSRLVRVGQDYGDAG